MTVQDRRAGRQESVMRNNSHFKVSPLSFAHIIFHRLSPSPSLSLCLTLTTSVGSARLASLHLRSPNTAITSPSVP